MSRVKKVCTKCTLCFIIAWLGEMWMRRKILMRMKMFNSHVSHRFVYLAFRFVRLTSDQYVTGILNGLVLRFVKRLVTILWFLRLVVIHDNCVNGKHDRTTKIRAGERKKKKLEKLLLIILYLKFLWWFPESIVENKRHSFWLVLISILSLTIVFCLQRSFKDEQFETNKL